MPKKLGLTKDELIALNPCSLEDRLALFGKRDRLTVRQAIRAGATVSDILWVARRLNLRDKIVAFAERVVDEVAHLKDRRATAYAAAYAAYAAAYAADAAAYAADADLAPADAEAADAAYAARKAAYAAAKAAANAADADTASACVWRQARQDMIARQKQLLIEIFG
ncbi:hypothetical protein [Sphingopyxis flava]|uniref:Uncharacterized protein n=1 Tax=Sphingopyxis flava TaxID=1507287 RepID=A0A1T5BRX5_9SPHN|nr:hypothetical protein [Sphingopyxis flava]SKB49901.1 hypothetical protein SAMN06295937_100786 [Sphingopyxis flava]